jgi:hypothetical protein
MASPRFEILGSPLPRFAIISPDGEGIDSLRSEILRYIEESRALQESGFLTNIRHQRLVLTAFCTAAAKIAVTNQIFTRCCCWIFTMHFVRSTRRLASQPGRHSESHLQHILH